MYAAIDLSKYIVSKCIKDGHPISNLQLQIILYYIQESFLKEKGVRAFSDDIESWRYGEPVVPNVYYRCCGFGAMPIYISMGEYSINPSDQNLINPIIENIREKFDVYFWGLVKDIYRSGLMCDKVFDKIKE